MTIAKNFSNPTLVAFPARMVDPAVETVAASEPVYNRILVVLDEFTTNDQVLRTAVALAHKHGAEIVMISENTPGSTTYIERTCRALNEQNIEAHGYTIGMNMQNIPAWLLKNERADAVIVAQQKVGWLGRVLGKDIAANICARTHADVIEVCI